MIRAIAAIDSKRGIADDHGIPWKLSADQQHFRELTEDQDVLMGFNTYLKLKKPLRNRRNLVWCYPDTVLRTDFEAVYDLDKYLTASRSDIWIIGGGKLYDVALTYCSELHLTQINADYNCTIFFPKFDSHFQLSSKSNLQKEGDTTYTYQTWTKKPS